jgi:hypothetical protein
MDLLRRFTTEKILVAAGCIASFLFLSFLDTFLVGGMREEKEGLLFRTASKRSDAGFRRL